MKCLTVGTKTSNQSAAEDAEGKAIAQWRRLVRGHWQVRIYLLYWYKSANNDSWSAMAPAGLRPLAGTNFTGFTSTTVQKLTAEKLRHWQHLESRAVFACTQFTSFTGTKVQILTQLEEVAASGESRCVCAAGVDARETAAAQVSVFVLAYAGVC